MAETARPAPARRERLWREVLGEQLRALRTDRGETLEAVGRRANLSTQYLSELERGLKEPSSEVVAALGTALDVTLVELTRSIADRLVDTATPSRGQVALAA